MSSDYGKLTNGNLSFAPNPVWINGKMIANPTNEMLVEFGYKKIERTEQPEYEEGYYFKPVYSETETQITQDWEKVQIEVPEENGTA